MKRLLFQYFSLLLLLFVTGGNVFGSENSNDLLSVSNVLCAEHVIESTEISTAPSDRHVAIERTLGFSHQQISFGGSKETVSLFFCRKFHVSSHKFEFRTGERSLDGCFTKLLGIRHIQGFYVFDLCKIVV